MTSEVMSGMRDEALTFLPMPSVDPAVSAFGSTLRRYRSSRAMSQERLALDADISTRHLSCLETGRAAPSRQMVLVLGSALDLPLRDRNAMLTAAGFTAAYGDEPLDAPQAASLSRAVDLILSSVEPNGAMACDRAWNVIRMNGGALRLLSAFLDVAAAPPEVMGNALIATLHPAGLRPAIVNFDEVAAFVLERARQEAVHQKDSPAVARVRDALARIPDLPRPSWVATASRGPFVSVHLRRGPLEARVFSTVTTIGTPIDATAEDIRIETFFPADDATAALMRQLEKGS